MMGEGFAKVETFGVIRLQVFLQEGQTLFRNNISWEENYTSETHGPL